MRQLGQGELAPKAVSQLVPVPARHDQGLLSVLLVPATAEVNASSYGIVLPLAVPGQEALADRDFRQLLLFLSDVEAVHLR